MEKSVMTEQIKTAFSLIQRLYFEVSLLIQEIENSLSQEARKF